MSEPAPNEIAVGPKHQLKTGLLGKPKHGRQRVSDLAPPPEDLAADQPPDVFENEEHLK